MSNMDHQQELLTIVMEECAEVIRECSKIQRFGLTPERNMLESEIGDLMCMIKLLTENKIIDTEKVYEASAKKREKLKKWSNLNV